MVGFNDLPEELVQLVVNFCQDYLTLAKLCHTSRRLRRIATPRLDRSARLELRVFGTDMLETRELMHFERSPSSPLATEVPFFRLVQDEAQEEHWKVGDVKLSWLPIIRLLDDFCECPILFQYIRHIALSFQFYPKPDIPTRVDGPLCLCTECAAIRKFPVTDRMRKFGQRAIVRFGIKECIDAWDTPDGWTALFLLLCPNLESLYFTHTDHPRLDRRRMDQVVQIALQQSPPHAFSQLKYVYSRDYLSFRTRYHDPLLWTFLELPGIRACEMPRVNGHRWPIEPLLRSGYVNFAQPGSLKHAQDGAAYTLPIPSLTRKLLSLPTPLRKFHYRVYTTPNDRPCETGRLNFRRLGSMLAHFHNSLEELWIDCPSFLVGAESPNAEQSSPLNPDNLIGTLHQFRRLDTVCVPVFVMFHDQAEVMLKELIPQSIEILEFSGEADGSVWKSRFFHELEDLIHSKYDRFPHLKLLRLHGYVLPYAAVELCRLYGITLRMDKQMRTTMDRNSHGYLF